MVDSIFGRLAKAQSEAREAQRKEQRKVLLPFTKPSDLGVEEYLQQLEETKRAAAKEKKELEKTTVKLDTGERIAKEAYEALSPEQQEKISTLGISAYNQEIEAQKAELEANNVLLDTGEYVNKDIYGNLSKDQQEQLNQLGVDAFNDINITSLIATQTEKLAGLVEVGGGEYISADSFNALSTESQEKIKELGVEGYNEWLKTPVSDAEYRQLPNDITEMDYSRLLQNEDGTKAFIAKIENDWLTNNKVTQGFLDWYNGRTPASAESLEQYQPVVTALQNTDEWQQYTTALNNYNVVKSFRDYLLAYRTDYKGKTFTSLPTKEQILYILDKTNPVLLPYLKAGDVIDIGAALEAYDSSYIVDVMKAAGIDAETIAKVDAAQQLQLRVSPYINKETNTVNVVGAIKGGISYDDVQAVTGLSAEDVEKAVASSDKYEYAQKNYINTDGTFNYDKFNIERTQSTIARAIEASGYNDATVQDLLGQGFTQDEINDVVEKIYVYNQTIPEVDDSYAEAIGATTAMEAPVLPDLSVITAQLRAEGTIDDTMEVTGYSGGQYIVTSVKKPTEVGVVYKEALDYLIAHPDTAMTPEVNAPLYDMGFDNQAIVNAQTAFYQIQKAQAQQAALNKVNASLEPIEYTQEQLDEIAIREAKGLSVPYYEYTAEALALYIKDNPVDGIETLKEAGFNDSAINTAVEISQMPYDEETGFYREGTAPNFEDYNNARNAEIIQQAQNIVKEYQATEEGKEAMARWAASGAITPLELADPEFYKYYETVMKETQDEYIDKYGAGAYAGSKFATVASLVFEPARAIAPDVTIKDISGAEWAIGAGQVLAYAAMPFGGITGGVIGKALDIGASAAFALNTAIEWDNLSLGQKIWNIGGNLGFLILPYAMGKLGQGIQIAKIYTNPETRALVELASDAGAAAREVKALKAAESLETGALFTRTAGLLQTAEGKAKMLTSRLLDKLSRLDDISSTLLEEIELKSGIRISNITKEVGQASKALKTAQQTYDDLVSQLPLEIKTPQDKMLSRMVADAKIARDSAQETFDIAMDRYADIMSGAKYERGSTLLAEERIARINDLLDGLKEVEAAGGTKASQIEPLRKAKEYKSGLKITEVKEGTRFTSEGTPYFTETGELKYRIKTEPKTAIQMEAYIDNNGKLQYKLVRDTGEIGSVIDETITPVTAEDIDLGNRMTYASEKAKLPYSEEISTYTETGGISQPPSKITPPEQIKTMERAALQTQINYLNTLGENAKTIDGYTAADIQRKMDTMELITPQYAVPSIIPVAVLLDAIKPEVLEALMADYSISPENISGILPITDLQLVITAKKLNMNAMEIRQNIDAGTLPRAVIYQAINNLPENQSKLITQSIVAAYPQTVIDISGIPEVIEWQQISSIITPTVLQQATTEQLEQIDNAQAIIEDINEKIRNSITQEPTIEQSRAIQGAQDIIEQVQQDIYAGIAPKTAIGIATKPMLDTGLYTEEYKEEKGETLDEEGKPIPKIIVKGGDTEKEAKRKAFKGALAWKQGIVWHAWKYPYKDDDEDLATFYKYPPEGVVVIPGKKSAQETIQLYLGKTPPPPDRKINMGIMDIYISTTPDGKLQIKYIEDKQQSRGKGGWFGGKIKEKRAKTSRSISDAGIANTDDYWSGTI